MESVVTIVAKDFVAVSAIRDRRSLRTSLSAVDHVDFLIYRHQFVGKNSTVCVQSMDCGISP